MRKNTLGKGLDALIDNEPLSAEPERFSLPLGRLRPGGGQPRKAFDEAALDGLAASIREKGLIQPLIVRKAGDGYEIIAGERRWRAAQKAGLREVPVIIREMADGEAMEIALIENIQREDLNPVEEALAYERLISDFGLTHEEIARRVGKSRSAITNHLRLLKLSAETLEELSAGRLSMGHARAALGLNSGEDEEAVVSRVISAGMSVRQTEALVRRINSGSAPARRAAPPAPDIHLKQAERSIREALGTKVIVEGGREKGRIVISYSSSEELERISSEIGGVSPVPVGK